MASESNPLLPSEEDKEGGNQEDKVKRETHNPTRWRWKMIIFMHGSLIVLYTLLGLVLFTRKETTIYSDGNSAPTFFETDISDNLSHTAPIRSLKIQYISKPFESLRESPYAQDPGPGVDDAWSSLLANMNIRASAEELERHGQTSVPLVEGGQYLVWLGVFHELHCIVRTLRRLHPTNNTKSHQFRICCGNGSIAIAITRI